MAQAIMKANGAGTFSSRGDLRLEIDILNNFGAGALENYATQAYDNSGDYWKVKLDSEGNVVQVLYDGDPGTITFVDENGKIKSVHKTEGSLSGQIANIAEEYQTNEEKQSQDDILNIMFDSGLDYNNGWYATNSGAIDIGSGYDSVYEAIKNGNYGEIQNIISNMGKNSETDISQEMVEEALGLPTASACAITASSELTNNFLQTIYGDSFESSELLEAIEGAQGEMFNNNSWVLSWNGLNASIAADFGMDNYPVFSGTYNDLEELNTNGIEFYLKKFIKIDNPSQTHFGSVSNNEFDDPYTTITEGNWYQTPGQYNTVYYGFKSKY